jgi:hypothetical protein
MVACCAGVSMVSRVVAVTDAVPARLIAVAATVWVPAAKVVLRS